MIMPNNDYMQTPIGSSTDDFITNGQTIKDTALITLINKVQMYYGEADLSVTAPLSSSGKIPKGTVRIEDIYSVYIYNNHLFTITITGAQLRKYLEFSVCKYYKTLVPGDTSINKNRNAKDYNLDILQGADYTVDLTKSGLFDTNGKPLPGGLPRITKLTYHGREVQDDQVFKLAMNSYRFKGGGGFLTAAGIKPQNKDPKFPNYITFDSQKVLGDNGQIPKLMIKYFQDIAAGKIIPGKTSVEPVYDNTWKTVPRFYDLLNFSDLHGHIDNRPQNGTPKINAALMAGAVNKERSIYGDECTILLASGDMMQGEAISNILKGKPVINIMNQMKFDAMELGNHEFDWGMDVLNKNIASAKFPFIAANMSLKQGVTDRQSVEFIKNIKPWVILNKDGLKVGIIGVINPNTANVVTPSTIGHFSFQNPVTTVNNLVPQVKSAGADIVVVLAQIGDLYISWPKTGPQPEKIPLRQSLARFAKKVKGVAAIFGGNSHTINYDLVPDATGTLIPAVIANDIGIGIIRLALDENNEVMSAIPSFLDIYNRLYPSLTPDPAVQAIVDDANEEIGSIITEVLCKAEVFMTRSTGSDENLDSNLGDWSADVIRTAGKADFGFLNAGALRINLPKGDITPSHIWTLMPFDNKVNTLDMTGAQIKTMLEYMVSGIKYRGHISGLRFTYDSTKPARFYLTSNGTVVENPNNNRIMWISSSDGTPLDMAKTYKVAASDFIATGGDYYPFPNNSTNLVSTDVLIRDAMMTDLKNRKTLNYLPDGRIQLAAFSTYQFVTPDLSNIKSNQQIVKNFGIKTISVGNTGYLKARVNIIINKPDGTKVEMLCYDPINKKYYDAVTRGYLEPKNGIIITPDFTIMNNFKLKFSRGGLYTIRYVLVNLYNNKEIISQSSTVLVSNTPPTITSNLRAYVAKDEKKRFTLKILANDYKDKRVRLKIALTNPRQYKDVELKYLNYKGKEESIKFEKNGVAWFGPPEGFLLSNTTKYFKVKFKEGGVFELTFEIVHIIVDVIKRETKIVEVLERSDLDY